MNLVLKLAVIGHFLQENINERTNTSKFLCVFKCYYDLSCTGFFYNKQKGMCYLANTLYSIQDIREQHLEEKPGYEYYEFTHEFCVRLQWYFFKPSGSCFWVSKNEATPNKAASICSSKNSSLLSLESRSEIAFYNGLADDFSLELVTSGKKFDGVWKWGNGKTITVESWIDDYPKSDNCLRVIDGDGWKDNSCTDEKHYVCERQLERELCP